MMDPFGVFYLLAKFSCDVQDQRACHWTYWKKMLCELGFFGSDSLRIKATSVVALTLFPLRELYNSRLTDRYSFGTDINDILFFNFICILILCFLIYLLVFFSIY